MERSSQENYQTHARLGDLGTGCVPGLGARPVNQDDDLPYSSIMCLDLIKVVSYLLDSPTPSATEGNNQQTLRKNNPFSPFCFLI